MEEIVEVALGWKGNYHYGYILHFLSEFISRFYHYLYCIVCKLVEDFFGEDFLRSRLLNRE